MSEIQLNDPEYRRAIDLSFKYLSYKEYSSGMLFEKLCREVSEEYAAAAVSRMCELSYVNDEDYARRLALDLRKLKKLGADGIRRELFRRKIPDEIIDYAVENALSEDDDSQLISDFIFKKYPQALNDEKIKRRAVAALLRRGFRLEDILRELKE